MVCIQASLLAVLLSGWFTEKSFELFSGGAINLKQQKEMKAPVWQNKG